MKRFSESILRPSRVIAQTLALLAPVALSSSLMAHGWVTSPPSRQDHCAKGKTSFDCGALQWEPQSVEAPKGAMSCSGGGAFSILDEERDWPVTSIQEDVVVTWKLTAPHRTSRWTYYLGDEEILSLDAENQVPGYTVQHSLSGLPAGRHTILAVWDIADTVNAFYSCLDVEVGQGRP